MTPTVRERSVSTLMEIRCVKEELLRGVQLVQSAISPRSTLPVLANILMESDAAGLRLSSTDLEVGVRCHVKADVVSSGATTVPAKTLNEFLRTLDDGSELSLSVDDTQKMEIKSGKDRCVLIGLPKEDYPALPEFNQDKSFRMDRGLLREIIRKSVFAVSTDETRYVLNGVHVIVDNGRLEAVATDGRRLAYIGRKIADKTAKARAIIPTKAVNELAKVLSLDGADGEILVSFTENQVTFKCHDTIILSRLIEGHFPNHEQVIPKNHEKSITFKAKQLLTGTQRAAVGTLEKGSSVRFSLAHGKLHIFASSQGRVEVEAEVPVDYKGEAFTMAFNPLYIIDGLKALDVEEVVMEFSAPLNPGVIRPVGDDDYRYVVMPMQLS